MLETYRQHVSERAEQGIPPLPLDANQTAALIELIKNPPKEEITFLLDLLTNCVPPGVDEASYVKASFLADVAKGQIEVSAISADKATFLLGTMLGGYNVTPLIELLSSDNASVVDEAVKALSKTLLVYDAFYDVETLAKTKSFTSLGRCTVVYF